MTESPCLILVHGTRSDAGQWDGYHGLLPGARLIAIDLPGHGRNDDAFTEESALAAISEAVDRAPTPPILVGHSLGGYVSMVWAQRHPDALAALVPIGATGDPTTRVTGVYRAYARLSSRVDHERLAARSHAVMRALGSRSVPANASGYAALPAAWQFVFDHASPELLRDLSCPVVLVNGQFDQMRLHVRRFASAAPNARVVTVPGATHLLPMTHAPATARVLREVIAETHG